jgi:hypothetical protein
MSEQAHDDTEALLSNGQTKENSSKTLIQAATTHELEPRGNFWEITYKEEIARFESWPLDKDPRLSTVTGKTNVLVTAKPGTRAVNLSEKEFQTCDFNHFTLEASSFSECRFVDCRFIKSNFNGVKFSRCHFERCHFLNVRFDRSQFLDCTFTRISASAEHLVFSETAIAASAFVDALETNLAALPKNITAEYQKHRLLGAKAKIARGIFISVRNEPELDLLFDANRSFEIALRRKDIAESYWTTAGKQLVRRGVWSRYVLRWTGVASLAITKIAGSLTNWGRSPFRSVWLLFSAFIVFSAIYCFSFDQALLPAMLRALDCAFVFGYTKYASPKKAEAIDIVMFLNAFTGFCWYALFIPALSKRLFR